MKIDKIKHISPSRYHRIRQCALAEVWFLTGNRPSVPTHANALLGSIIHKVLERFSCERNLTDAEFENVWKDAEVAIIKKHEDEKWRYNPLQETASYYFSKKINLLKVISGMMDKKGQDIRYQTLSEEPLTSFDGLIKGSADLIVKRNEDNLVTIIDFKTGKIFDETGSIKKEYADQLKFYALLFNQNKDRIFKGVKDWPDHLLIMASDGSYHSVEYTPAEAIEYYEEVKKLILEINEVIGKGDSLDIKLARAGEHCANCSFRLDCNEYLSGDFESEYDLKGEVGSLFLTADKKKAVIRLKNSPWVIQYFLQDGEEIECETGQKIIITSVRKEKLERPIAFSTRFSKFHVIQ